MVNKYGPPDTFTFTYSRFDFADSNNNYDSATLRVRGCRMCAVRELSTVKRERYIYIFIDMELNNVEIISVGEMSLRFSIREIKEEKKNRNGQIGMDK